MAPDEIHSNLPLMLTSARRAAKFTNAKSFLAAVKESGRKAPSYSSYAQWESGVVKPRVHSLEPIIEFHRKLKTWPDEQPENDLASAIRELTEELRGSREDRKVMRDEVEGLKTLVGNLAAQLQREQELTARLAKHVQLDSTESAK